MMIEIPQSFVVREECQKAASQSGFRRLLGEEGGWAAFGSTTAQGKIYLAARGALGPWFLALDHAGVIREVNFPEAAITGPGLVRFEFLALGELYRFLERIYELDISLPDVPLKEFEKRTEKLPRGTEAERFVIQRIGQDIFRKSLLDYWQHRCPLTGISDPALLRASHIIPWADCKNDFERLNVYNGLLLSALWDAAFDRALVTFDDHGIPEFSSSLSDQARCSLTWISPLRLTPSHRSRLILHRARFSR
ncbi:HNH endonuclease [Acetobacter persici]|nr:HNH endonuclease [Acetobacter persici]